MWRSSALRVFGGGAVFVGAGYAVHEGQHKEEEAGAVGEYLQDACNAGVQPRFYFDSAFGCGFERGSHGANDESKEHAAGKPPAAPADIMQAAYEDAQRGDEGEEYPENEGKEAANDDGKEVDGVAVHDGFQHEPLEFMVTFNGFPCGELLGILDVDDGGNEASYDSGVDEDADEEVDKLEAPVLGSGGSAAELSVVLEAVDEIGPDTAFGGPELSLAFGAAGGQFVVFCCEGVLAFGAVACISRGVGGDVGGAGCGDVFAAEDAAEGFPAGGSLAGDEGHGGDAPFGHHVDQFGEAVRALWLAFFIQVVVCAHGFYGWFVPHGTFAGVLPDDCDCGVFATGCQGAIASGMYYLLDYSSRFAL